MRTTLDIDDDLLLAAKERARRENRTAGQVVSSLLRRSLTGAGELPPRVPGEAVAGFVPFYAQTGVVVTNDMVNRLRDEEGV